MKTSVVKAGEDQFSELPLPDLLDGQLGIITKANNAWPELLGSPVVGSDEGWLVLGRDVGRAIHFDSAEEDHKGFLYRKLRDDEEIVLRND
jgi:hypothetical protein